MKRRSYFEAIVRFRVAVLAGATILLVLSAWGASRVEIDYGVEQLLPAWGEDRERYDDYTSVFPREDARVSFFLHEPGPPDSALVARLRPVVDAFGDVGLEDIEWIGAVPEALRDDPSFTGVLRDSAGTTWAVHGYLDAARNDDAGRRRMERELTASIAELNLPADRYVLSGVPVLRSRIPLLLESDQRLFLGGGTVLFALLILLFLGRVRNVATCLAASLPAWLTTLGVMALLGRSVSILTSFVPIVVLVVGVSDAIHLVNAFRTRREAGRSAREAVVDAFSELAPTCFYTSVTTAVGFAALAGTGIGTVMEFGLFTALAVLLTWGYAMTVLPALLASDRRPAPGRAGRTAAARALVTRGAASAGRFGTTRPAPVLIAFAAVSLVGIALASRLEVDTYLVDDLEEESRVMRDLRWIEERGFGLFQINVLVRAEPAALTSPAMLDWMRRLDDVGRSESMVLATVGPHDAVGFARRVGLPPEAALTDDLHRPDAGAAQVVFSVRDAGSIATLPFLQRLDRWIARNPPPSGSAHSTGLVQLYQDYVGRTLSSFGPSLALGMALIFGLMTLMFRSVRLGALAMVPNVVPLIVVAGLMSIGGFAVKPSTILVFSIAFAIAVDDSIHLLGALRRAHGRGVRGPRAVRAAVSEAGPAIVMTTCIVGSGFGLLTLSSFEVLFLVGLLTVVSSVAAVLADLLLFPAVLTVREPGPTRHAATAVAEVAS